MKRFRLSRFTIALLGVFFVVSVLFPLVTLFLNLKNVDVLEYMTSSRFGLSALNSLFVSLVSMIISVSIGLALSYFVMRTNVKWKGFFKVVFTLPMLIPSISHGMSLVILLGRNGLLTNMFNWGGDIYGFFGIVLGSILYSYPVAFLMISDILEYEDFLPHQAAKILGIPSIYRFISISIPYLIKPMISVFFAIFAMIVTDYGVPLMVGGKFITLPVLMYQDVIGLLDFGKGSVIGLVLIIPAFVGFAFDNLFKNRKTSRNGNTGYIIKPNKKKDVLSFMSCAIASIIVAIPVLSFLVLAVMKKYPSDNSLTVDHFVRFIDLNGMTYFTNSLFIASIVAIIGVIVAFTCAYITSREKNRSSKWLHLLSMITLAIPGLVLGLSYVLFFKSTFIYGTFAILILVNTIHFFSSPYLMAYNSLGKLNSNIENVGRTLGISRFNVIKDVIIPQSYSTILEMFSYFFVNSMMTISAVSFLYNVSTKPLSLMIVTFEGQRMLECAAMVSFIILLVNILMKAVIAFIKNKIRRRDYI